MHTSFGKKVARIEVKNQEVIFEDVGLKYDKPVIATGAKAMAPQIGGTNKTGVFILETLEDVYKIFVYHKREVVVIGSGFIDVEAGWIKKALHRGEI